LITDFPNYVIFYRVKGEGVEIVRVLHGARDIDALPGGSRASVMPVSISGATRIASFTD